MILKKSLKTKHKLISGQAALEYFILFSAMLAIGLVSVSTFLPKLRETIQGNETQQGYSKAVADKIINADGGGSQPIPYSY